MRAWKLFARQPSRRRGRIAALAVLLALAAPARGADARIDRLDLVEAGFYDAGAVQVAGSILSPGAAAGKTLDLGEVRLTPDPPANSARVGVGFAVRFRPFGEPAGARVALRSVWKIPDPGIRNPNNGNTFRQSVADFTAVIGDLHLRGYEFDEPWEVVPGIWTLEIWQGDRKLLEKSFTIAAPAAPAPSPSPEATPAPASESAPPK